VISSLVIALEDLLLTLNILHCPASRWVHTKNSLLSISKYSSRETSMEFLAAMSFILSFTVSGYSILNSLVRIKSFPDISVSAIQRLFFWS
jgi:hypothetical protein